MGTISDDVAPSGGRPPVLVATKFQPPTVHAHAVPRTELLARLRSGADRKLALVACPAGFGKTTLLAEWRKAAPTTSPIAWLSLDESDNDPVTLWSYAIEALRRVCPGVGDLAVAELVGSASIEDVVLPRLVNELDGNAEVTLILDDFHRLSSSEARDSVAWFIDHAPPSFQLVLSTRREPSLSLAALRAHGDLLELRADDLRFTSEEAESFLNARLGLSLAPEDVADLVKRTEGWPAGLYLAALSLRGVDDSHAFVQGFGASNRHVVDFLVDEVLDADDPAMQELMLHSSILERICGSLCDAVQEREGTAAMLEALARSNLFLTPLDDRGEWYRFHHLYAQLLRVQLDRREPGLAPTLHRRAYAWHLDHGTTDEAIHHAIEAAAFAEAAELIEGSWVYYANVCRFASVLAWLQRLPDEVLRSDARLLLVQAWVLSLSAREEEAARAIAAVEALANLADGPLPDGFSSIESSVTTLRAVLPWGDVGAQLEYGLRAAELEGPESPWRPVACWAVGMGRYFHGEFDQADRWFEECVTLAPASEQWLVAGSSLAYRSLIAGEQDRHEDQQRLAEQATELARDRGLEEVDGEVPLALGVSLAAAGKLANALPLIEKSLAVLRSWGQPIDLVKALIREASVLRALSDRERAAAAIHEARSILDTCPDPGILRGRLEALEGSTRSPAAEGDELSERELEVLRLLSGSLSEREIARELYLSHNTVHTHTRSIYRKLGVSSRADAVAQARHRGLLTHSFHLGESGPQE